ncbi:alpha/beta-type small acid-soluble spore protein [Tepidibacter formicigenes]|jgi:hypothetical protein|uniref:Small, acid-soluble spore protein, alpha/beta type n=1 Tax=Tepidibacter formicigenes DSM 15518 TaxID=1123349 RepID=A0A1M6L1T7_9FIRM|nr:alpha/beta-type small acid-soluble spore protein [Tepidibacter formicigenes]SHJ65094.1 Small, acid-soluble spore protein, alpha/beta type [Tepidibacter formicigenes DSM 15518]
MSKQAINPNAVKALNQMKYEIANELGIGNNITNDKSDLSSGKNVFYGGYVGGAMTKKLVEMGEQMLIDKNKKD